MKTMTVSMICAGLMTMGTAAIAAESMQPDVYATLAMSHEDGEKDAMGHDEMGSGEMSREEMGDEMSGDEMGQDEMGHGDMDRDGMDKDDEMDDEMGGGMGE